MDRWQGFSGSLKKKKNFFNRFLAQLTIPDGWMEVRADLRLSFSARVDGDRLSIRIDIEADFNSSLQAQCCAPVVVAAAASAGRRVTRFSISCSSSSGW